MNKNTTKEINLVMEEYGEPIFRMALTHLFDVGIQNLTEKNVDKTIKTIQKQEEERIASNSKGTPLMTIDFQIELLQCALKLAKYSVWDLLYFVKKNIFIG